jgi:hypothetical protein
VCACHIFVENGEHDREKNEDKGKDEKNGRGEGFAELVIEESPAVESYNVDWCLESAGGLNSLRAVPRHPYRARLLPHRLEFR